MRTLPLATVRDKLSALVNEVESTHERIVVTRNGRPAAVLLSPDDIAGLEETLDVLSDPDTMRQLRESEDGLARGEKGLDADELTAFLAARRTRPVEAPPVAPKG